MKNKVLNFFIILMIASVLTCFSGSICLVFSKIFSAPVVLLGLFILSLVSICFGLLVAYARNQVEEIDIEILEESELEHYLRCIATSILRANNIEFQDAEQESDDLSYCGFLPDLHDEAQRLATIRIADFNKVLINYCLYFIGDDHINIAWFTKE